MSVIIFLEALQALHKKPGEQALAKELSAIDKHCRRFIELSPFLVLTTVDAHGAVTPVLLTSR